jgi:DNA end-binding protein Ku
MRGKEYVISLKPCGRGILMETLRYADEVHKAQGYFRDIGDVKPDPELLELAETLIQKKASKFDPGKFHDHYVDALQELIERKRKGATIKAEEEEAPSRGSNVVDLMAALKKSIERPAEKPEKTGAKKAPAAKAKKAAAKPAPARKRA